MEKEQVSKYQSHTGYVLDGKLYADAAGDIIQVESSSDLSDVAEACPHPGTIAYTAGFAHIWQLHADGTTWVQIS